MTILEVKDIHFGYDDVPVLKSLSFLVDRGDFVGVIGPNGTGKSTLFKLIMGLLQPEKGSIALFGDDPENARGRRISYVAQKSAVMSGGFPATALEAVLTGLSGRLGLFRRIGKEDKLFAMQCLETVGVGDSAKKLLSELSGGQLQRVMIARALAGKPDLMLLDEPTIGIDTRSVEDICCLLARLNSEQKLTILMITHDMTSVISHANKILLFDENGGAESLDNTGGAAMDIIMRDVPKHGGRGRSAG